MPSEVSVTPSCIAAMNCGGSLVILQHRARAPVALVVQLDDPRPAGRDEAYSAATKKALSRISTPTATSSRNERHAPLSRGAGTRRELVHQS